MAQYAHHDEKNRGKDVFDIYNLTREQRQEIEIAERKTEEARLKYIEDEKIRKKNEAAMKERAKTDPELAAEFEKVR